jgi:hypothetical protein
VLGEPGLQETGHLHTDHQARLDMRHLVHEALVRRHLRCKTRVAGLPHHGFLVLGVIDRVCMESFNEIHQRAVGALLGNRGVEGVDQLEEFLVLVVDGRLP